MLVPIPTGETLKVVSPTTVCACGATGLPPSKPLSGLSQIPSVHFTLQQLSPGPFVYLHFLRVPPDQNLRPPIRLRPPRQDPTLEADRVSRRRRELTHRTLLGHGQQLVLEALHDPRIDEIEHASCSERKPKYFS